MVRNSYLPRSPRSKISKFDKIPDFSGNRRRSKRAAPFFEAEAGEPPQMRILLEDVQSYFRDTKEHRELTAEVESGFREFIFLCAGYSTHKRFVLGGEECAAPFACKTLVSCKTLVTY
jgi:hypothetical protein